MHKKKKLYPFGYSLMLLNQFFFFDSRNPQIPAPRIASVQIIRNQKPTPFDRKADISIPLYFPNVAHSIMKSSKATPPAAITPRYLLQAAKKKPAGITRNSKKNQ